MTSVLDRAASTPTGTYRAGSGTAPARLVISAVSLAAVAIGLLGLATGVGPLRVIGLGGYLLFGVGAAPWTRFRRMELPLRLVLSVGASLSVLVLLSAAMLQLGLWYPAVAAALILVPTVPLHVLGLITAVRDHAPGARRPDVPPALALSVTGALICLVTALTHRHITPGFGGFLVEIGPLWYLGLALIVVALALARSGAEFVMATGVLLLMLVLTGTPGLVYDGPRSQSASKHVELVQQIRDLHHLESTVAVYNGWPGYFSAMAWFSDVTGVRDPINIATAWPTLIGLARLVALRYLAGQLIADRGRVWIAVALGILVDTIGQDYFSPQSVGFAVGVMVFGLALADLPLRHKVAAMTVGGTTISVAHQLSPYAVGGALCVLVVFRQIRPWWLPATVLGPAVGWALLHWHDLRNFLYFDDMGNSANLKPPSTELTAGLARMPIVAINSYALLLGVLVLGLLAAVTLFRSRRDRRAWALALCPSVGVVIILVNPYGNEGIFRAALFGIPWLAVLAAQAFRTPAHRRPMWSLLLTLTALSATFLVGTFGMDATNVLRPRDRDAFQQFQATNPGSDETSFLLVLGPGDLPSSPPTQSRLHIAVKRSYIDDAGFRLNYSTPSAIAANLTTKYVQYAGKGTPAGHLYALWSPVSAYYGQEYGIHTREQFTALRDAFADSPAWKTVYASEGTVMFEYTGR